MRPTSSSRRPLYAALAVALGVIAGLALGWQRLQRPAPAAPADAAAPARVATASAASAAPPPPVAAAPSASVAPPAVAPRPSASARAFDPWDPLSYR